MTRFTEEMKKSAARSRLFIFATASRDGKPNGVPMGLARIISDDEIMLVDNFLNKTRRNIEENPLVAVSFWNAKDHGGYQFKGKARVETSGKFFDMAVKLVQDGKPPFPIKTKAAVIVKVDEIYRIGANRDSSINLAELGDDGSNA
jgi:predicted pyridoxine 5'-phosphate oxidase superfamily flavin-nucleotide-binding protein